MMIGTFERGTAACGTRRGRRCRAGRGRAGRRRSRPSPRHRARPDPWRVDDVEAGVGQPVDQGDRHPAIVLHHQDPHGPHSDPGPTDPGARLGRVFDHRGTSPGCRFPSVGGHETGVDHDRADPRRGAGGRDGDRLRERPGAPRHRPPTPPARTPSGSRRRRRRTSPRAPVPVHDDRDDHHLRALGDPEHVASKPAVDAAHRRLRPTGHGRREVAGRRRLERSRTRRPPSPALDVSAPGRPGPAARARRRRTTRRPAPSPAPRHRAGGGGDGPARPRRPSAPTSGRPTSTAARTDASRPPRRPMTTVAGTPAGTTPAARAVAGRAATTGRGQRPPGLVRRRLDGLGPDHRSHVRPMSGPGTVVSG